MIGQLSRYFHSKAKLENDENQILQEEIDDANEILNNLDNLSDKYDIFSKSFYSNLIELVKLHKDYISFFQDNFTISTKTKKNFFFNQEHLEINSEDFPKNEEILLKKQKIYFDYVDKCEKDSEYILSYTSYDAKINLSENFKSIEVNAIKGQGPIGTFEIKNSKTIYFNISDDNKFMNTKVNSFYDYKVSDNTLNFLSKLNESKSKSLFFTEGLLSKDKFLNKYNVIKDKIQKYIRKRELIVRGRSKQKEKDINIGYVYVLSNKAYPDIYKIGSTYNLPEERAEELTGTGHLTPFKVEYEIKLKSAEYFEKLTHKLFSPYRVDKNREFFQINLENIKEKLKLIKIKSNDGENKITINDIN